VLDAVLDALSANTRVEALYCQNFEKGLLDGQLDRLAGVLRRRRIWALNVGENFGTTQAVSAPACCCPNLPLPGCQALSVARLVLVAVWAEGVV